MWLDAPLCKLPPKQRWYHIQLSVDICAWSMSNNAQVSVFRNNRNITQKLHTHFWAYQYKWRPQLQHYEAMELFPTVQVVHSHLSPLNLPTEGKKAINVGSTGTESIDSTGTGTDERSFLIMHVWGADGTWKFYLWYLGHKPGPLLM